MALLDQLITSGNLILFQDYRSNSYRDWSVNENNGKPDNTFLTNDGAKFNGEDSVIDVDDNSSLTFSDANGDTPFTFFALVRSENFNFLRIYHKGHFGGGTGEYAFFTDNSSRLWTFIVDQDNTAYIGRKNGISLDIYRGQDIFLAFTYSGNYSDPDLISDHIKQYLDGTRIDTSDIFVDKADYVQMTNQGQDLNIGMFLASTSSYGIFKCVGMANTELSQVELQTLESELRAKSWTKKSKSRSVRSNYIDYGQTGLEAAFDMVKEGTTLEDLTTNGNDITLPGTFTYSEESIGIAGKFDGSTSGLIDTPTADLQAITSNSFAMSVWVKATSATANQVVVSQKDGGGTGTGRSWLVLNDAGGATGADISSEFLGLNLYTGVESIQDRWYHVVLNQEVVGGVGSFDIWVNGTRRQSTNTSVNEDATGDFVIAADKTELAGFCDAYMHEMLIFDRKLEEYEIEALSKKGVVQYKAEFGNREISAAITSAGFITDTPFRLFVGQILFINDDRNGDINKVFKGNQNGTGMSISSGRMNATNTEAAFGTWEFSIRPKLVSSYSVGFICESEAFAGAVTQNSYYITVNSSGKLSLVRNDLGIGTVLFATSDGYIAADDVYNFKITRENDGQMTVYIRGGSFGNEYQAVTVNTGTNPVTDTTFNTSNYFIVGLQDDDRFYLSGIRSRNAFVKKLTID